MRNRRLLLILIGVVIIICSLIFGVLYSRIQTGGEEPQPTPQPAMVPVVFSAQNIARGQRITEDSVYLQNWPIDAIPVEALTTREQAYGQIARVDIARGTLLVASMLTTEGGEVLGSGSEASMQIPEGRVAYAFPISRYSSVAWALRPGDHVDVIISLLLIDLDEEFQTIMPNSATCPSVSEGETCMSGLLGRLQILPNGMVVNVIPSEPQRPRLVTQLTIQDALVLRIGDWPMAETVGATPAGETNGDTGTRTEGETAPSVPTVLPLTVAITPQDAVALEYALMSNAHITVVLRPAAAQGNNYTESVTLQYLMERYNIAIPPRLPYGITPPVNDFPPAE